MKSKNSIIFLAIGIVISLLLYKQYNKTATNALYTIGILQTASHPALDATRDGFIAQIKKSAGDSIDFVIRNGQGSVDSMHTIAQQFHAKQNIDAIFTIATPATQAMASIEKEKPIIIAAVSTSPTLSSILSQPNVCGISDMIDVRKEIEAMKALLPATARTIGIIFCTAEINAVAMAQVMVTQLESVGYTPITIGITSETDIEPALLSAIRNVDALLAPTDNIVASSVELIASIAHNANKPLILSDNMLVKQGALMARGVDYYDSGKQAGTIALQVLLNNKKPQELPIVPADNQSIFVNKQIMERLQLTIADSIAKDVIFVE